MRSSGLTVATTRCRLIGSGSVKFLFRSERVTLFKIVSYCCDVMSEIVDAYIVTSCHNKSLMQKERILGLYIFYIDLE